VRAVRIERHGEPADVVRLADVPDPVPGPGQAVLEVEAAALNLPDVSLCRGSYLLRPTLPFTPGLDAGGVIGAVGPGVAPELVGRRVTSVPELPHGGLAERALVAVDRLYEIPDAVPMVDAVAAQIVFQTAHLTLHHRGRLAPGESVVVFGAAGGVGSAALQLARLAGARVIAVAGGSAKAAFCLAHGADFAIDHVSTPDVAAAVRELTGGRGADLVVDPVGGPAFEQARRGAAVDGRILVVGFASGEIPSAALNDVLLKSYSLVGVYVGAYASTPEGRALVQRTHAAVMELLAAGKIRPAIDRVVGLDGVAGALGDLAERRSVGKIVVDPAR
jgi:NADPH2:quinone reductase